MMPEFFSETETNTGATEAKKVKKLLFWSYALKVASLLFVVLSVVFSPYYLIGFAIFVMSGIALKQSVLERTASFEYFFVRDTLKISAFSNFGKKKYEISIPINDIVSIEREFERIPEKTDVFAAPEGKRIIKIRFIENSLTRNLYFSPCLYLEALIRNRKNDLL